ncbi:MAG: ABC transporter ATP-binding protein [bacterium]|jgi:iron complex transport system ATP-binding protein
MVLAAEALTIMLGRKAILQGVSLTLHRGRFYAILGPNGAGKTTLLRALLGFIKPRVGQILINGHNISRLSCRELARHLALVPQEHRGVFPYTVREMVMMGRNPHLNGKCREEDLLAVERALTRVGLETFAERNYLHLSGGEKQLVFIARALAQEAAFLLLDEPTSHLDYRNQQQVMSVIKAMTRQGTGVLAALHDPNLALQYADQAILLKGGQVLAAGPPREVLSAENLSELYGIGIEVSTAGGRPFVLPSP